MKNRIYIICGAVIGLLSGVVGLAIAEASVPRPGQNMDDTAIVGNVSEIQIAKLDRTGLDDGLSELANREHSYREHLPTEAEILAKKRAELRREQAVRAARMAPQKTAWHRAPLKRAPRLAERSVKPLVKRPTNFVLPSSSSPLPAQSSSAANQWNEPSSPQVIRDGKHVFILQ